MIPCQDFSFYEFFAGGGMARAGLGESWRCQFANDFDEMKASIYKANWGNGDLVVEDVRKLNVDQLPGSVDLAWASFPCQDLSLAGNGAGLKSERSGSFWPFWALMRDLRSASRAPNLILLENVCGALTSHGGDDFASICDALVSIGYRVGALVVNAVDFLPQSRARLFIIGVASDLYIPSDLVGFWAYQPWHPKSMVDAFGRMEPKTAQSWIWWRLPPPPGRSLGLSDIVEPNPKGVRWKTDAETQVLLDMMSPQNLQKVESAKKSRRMMVGGVYRRTRAGIQRAEVRFDDIAGCLRTPAGGSSRQLLLFVEGDRVRSRLLSAREAIRLMGLSDEYIIPENYNATYHLAGDGVAVPVVRYLADSILEPIILSNRDAIREVA